MTPPEPGDPLLINPRFENPLEFLLLDLRDTFRFDPLLSLDAASYLRAEYTIEILGLNRRDTLVAARKEAYENYHDRLFRCVRQQRENATPAELDRLRSALQNMKHPTVWKEMQRQHTLLPNLKPLFDELPDARNW